MVIMSCLNRAALLCVQLVAVYQVFADTHVVDRRNKLVFRGRSDTLMCNTSLGNITQINWKKGRDIFAYRMGKNTSNLPSHRVRINSDPPLSLDILDAQPDDTGLYTCTVTYETGIPRITEWNLTVSEKPGEIPASLCPDCKQVYMLPVVIGCLLCGFASAVCLFRKIKMRKSTQNPVQDQIPPESDVEVGQQQRQVHAETRRNKKHRTQYMERLNSIYGSY